MSLLYVLDNWRQVAEEFAHREEREINDVEIEEVILVVEQEPAQSIFTFQKRHLLNDSVLNPESLIFLSSNVCCLLV